MAKSKKQYTTVCRICGKTIVSSSANKHYCDECFQIHRAQQSAQNYRRLKARKEYEKIMALSDKRMNDSREGIGIPADYIEKAEQKLLDWAGISYGYFSIWKAKNGIAYLEWLVRLRECYKKRGNEYGVILPDVPPTGLTKASSPQPHCWGGERHKIWE